MKWWILFYLLIGTQVFAALSLEQKSLHLLNRMAFGPTPREMTQITKQGEKGLQQWFNEQLYPEKILEPELEAKINQLEIPKMSTAALLKAYPKKTKETAAVLEMESMDTRKLQGKPKQILQEMIEQKLAREIESKKQFQEVLVDFWFNHFNVAFAKNRVKWFLPSYERDVIRPHVFGKFKDLLKATAQSPAMMFYLDNFQSSKVMTRPKDGKTIGINENYARELLELHTMGVDSGYTQKDVQETARVLTGWSIDNLKDSGEFTFKRKRHDPGAKTVMSFKVPGDQGIAEGEKLLEYLSLLPQTAKNISKKLAQKFISDKPTDAEVNAIADTFLKTGGDLREVYKKIFSMKEFWVDDQYKSKIRDPLEQFVAVARALQVKMNFSSPKNSRRIFQYFQETGEPLYNCQPPTGFKMTSATWVSAGALVSRINMALFLAQNASPAFDYPYDALEKNLDAKQYKTPMDVLNTLNSQYFYNQVKSSTLQSMSTQFSEFDLLTENHSRAEHSIHYFPLKKMLGLLLSAPEMQRR